MKTKAIRLGSSSAAIVFALTACGDLSLDGDSTGFDFPEVSSVLLMTLPSGLSQLENGDISSLESDNDGLSSAVDAFKLFLNLAPTSPELSSKDPDDLSGRILSDVGAIDEAMADIEAALSSADLTQFECLQAPAQEVNYDFNFGSGTELPNVTLKLQCKTGIPGATNGSGIAFGQSESDFYIHLHQAPPSATAEEGADKGLLLLVHVNGDTFEATVTAALVDPQGAGTSDDVHHIYQLSSKMSEGVFKAYSIGINQSHGLGCGLRMIASTNFAYLLGNFGSTNLSACTQIGAVDIATTTCMSSRSLSSATSDKCASLSSRLDGFPSRTMDADFRTQTSEMGDFFSIDNLPVEVLEITLPEVPSESSPSASFESPTREGSNPEALAELHFLKA